MRYTLLSLLLVSLFFLGCEQKFEYASKAKELNLKSDKEERVSQRALEYWELLSTLQFNKAYAYELPFQRYEHTLEWYQTFNKGNDKHYTLTQLKIVPIDDNRVIIKTEFKAKKAKFIMSDKWYLVNGTWYHKMNTTKLPTLETW